MKHDSLHSIKLKRDFLKSAGQISELVTFKAGPTANSACASSKKTSNLDGTVVGYPEIEAIFDFFWFGCRLYQQFASISQIHAAYSASYYTSNHAQTF